MNDSFSSLSPPLKLVPWSDRSSKGLPRLEMNRHKAIKKESVSMLVSMFMWTAREVMHLKMIPHLFSFLRPTFIV